MLQHLDPIPFTIDNDAHMGLSEAQGLLSCDGESLVMEFRIADTITGALKTGLRHLTIPLAEVRSIQFQRKMMGMAYRIALRTRTQGSLETLPNAKMGEVALVILRRDREAAEAFCLAVHEVVVRLRGQRLLDDVQKLDEGRSPQPERN